MTLEIGRHIIETLEKHEGEDAFDERDGDVDGDTQETTDRQRERMVCRIEKQELRSPKIARSDVYLMLSIRSPGLS